MYLSEFSKNKQKAIINEAKKGDTKSIDTLINSNIKSIYKIAHRFKKQHVEFDDLVQEGIKGLIKEAIPRFQFNKKTNFNTFSNYWILNYISEYARQNSRTIRIPNYLIAASKKITKYKNDYYQKYNENPSDKNVCDSFKITKNRLNNVYSTYGEIVSLDLENEENSNMFNYIPDKLLPASKYKNVFNVLTEEERELLEKNSGVFGGQKVVYRDLAKEYGKSFQYIKTTIDKSKRKIKKELKKLKYA